MPEKNQRVICQSSDTVIISDVHLGSRSSQSEKLYHFLDSLLKIFPQKLIINGDFFELWSTNYKKIGSIEYKVVRKILELSQEGVKVVYIPGNHDRAFRTFQNFDLGKIKIKKEYILKKENKKYVVIHGDEFDIFTQNHVILSLIIDQLYVFLIKAIGFFKRYFGFRFSLAAKKQDSKKYQKIIAKVRKAALKYARSLGVDGVIIGHTHYPEVFVDSKGIIFANSGDWVEHCSYLLVNEEIRVGYF